MREQEIMQDILNDIGSELDVYISSFYTCDLWTIKEGEVKVNKTFKRIVDIVASYNLTTYENTIGDVHSIARANSLSLGVMDQICRMYLNNGGSNLLNRIMLFCYFLYNISLETGKSATEILSKAINSELIKPKTTWWHTLKYKLGFVKYPYKLSGDVESLALVSLLKGSAVEDIVVDVARYKELI